MHVWHVNKDNESLDYGNTQQIHKVWEQSFLNWPRLLQNSPSMPSGLAVGICVRPVRIKTSLFFRELWSIGCEKHNMIESKQNPTAALLAQNALSAENNAKDTQLSCVFHRHAAG